MGVQGIHQSRLSFSHGNTPGFWSSGRQSCRGFCDVCTRLPCFPPHCQCLSLVLITSHLETPIKMEVEVISTWVSSASLPQKGFIFILKASHQPPGRAQILSGKFPGSYGAKMGNWEEGGGPRVGRTRFACEAAPWSKKHLHRTLLSSKCYSKGCGFKKKQDTEFLLSNHSHLRHVDCWRGKMATMCCYVFEIAFPLAFFRKQKKRLECF